MSLPVPHWMRSSLPLILSLCRLGQRSTKSRVQNHSARTKRGMRKFYSDFNTVLLLCPSCCLLLV